jgi:hypothetical protein
MSRMTCWSTLGLALTLAGPLSAQKPTTVDPLCDRVLPVATVERITGLTHLALIPRRSIPTAGGTCNYAGDDHRMVLLLTVLDERDRAEQAYLRYKAQPPYKENQKEVRDLGDAAFTGGTYEHEVVARKGGKVIMLASMLHRDKATRQTRATVSREQLLGLAREVVARL